MRSSYLRMVSEKMAGNAGHAGTGEDSALRGQILLAAILGIILLRATTGMRPLSTAGADELNGPVTDLVAGLLPSDREHV